VIATHDLHLIDRCGARRIGFRDGRVAAPAGTAPSDLSA
jgi:ABC-type ATPase involved in cell division